MAEALSKIMSDHGAMAVVLVFVGIGIVYIVRRLFGKSDGILTLVGSRQIQYFDKLDSRDERRDTFCKQHADGMSAMVEQQTCTADCLKALCEVHHDSDSLCSTKQINASAADGARAGLIILNRRTDMDPEDKTSLTKICNRIIEREERRKNT